jgi:signal transduction histidine kinase
MPGRRDPAALLTRHRDWLLALAFAAWGVAGAFVSNVLTERWVIALAGLPIALALVWRRTAPRAVAVVLYVAYVLHSEVVPEVVPSWGITTELLGPLAVFGVAAYGRSAHARWQALAFAVVFGATAVYISWRHALPFHNDLGLYVYPLATLAGGLVAGIALRDRTTELETASERLREEERTAPGETERLDAARMAIAHEIHQHLTVRLQAISRHVATARSALETNATAVWAAAMREVQDAASAAMHGLRATLSVLGDDAEGNVGPGHDAEAQLRAIAELDGAARGKVRVRVTVDGRLPEPLRGLAALGRRIAADGVELLLEHARGPARVELTATDTGAVLRLGAGGPGWWWRARGSVERARLLEIARLGGQVRKPRPWRPVLEVRLSARLEETPVRADAWQAQRERVRGSHLPFDPGMRLGAALVPVGLLTLLGVVEWALTEIPKVPHGVQLGGALVSALPFVYRARRPLAVVAAVTALLLGRQLLGDLGTPTISQNFFLYFGMFVVGAYARSVPAAIAGWLIVFGGGLAGILHEGVDYPPDAYVFYSVALTAAGATGVAVRRRVRQAAELDRVRAEIAERRREAVATALATERMHVARELHDVVGHSVTLMAVQAGAATALADRDPAAAQASVGSVIEYEAVARAELEQLLRALHSAGAASPAPATPDDLVELVERSRRGGLPVEFEADGDLAAVAPWLVGTVYRIVQEALTNVRRHAGHAATSVSVRIDGARLSVEVRNGPGSSAGPSGAGAGIEGMRERTVVQGGDLHAGPTPDGGWRVHAVLPVGEREPPDMRPSADARARARA